MTIQPANPDLPPATSQKAAQLARDMETRLTEIEEIPDYKLRQDETVKLLVKSSAQVDDDAIKKLFRISTVSVHDNDTVYSALKIARLTHDALVNGCYGSPPQLAGIALSMLDTLQFAPQKTVSSRILKEMQRLTDDPVPQRAYEMASEIQRGTWLDTTADPLLGVAREILSTIARGFNGTPAEVMQLGLNLCRRAHGAQFSGFTMEPIIKNLILSTPKKDAQAKTAYTYGWKLARHMTGEKAAEYLSSIVAEASTLPKGEEKYYHLTGEALGKFQGRKELSAASDQILAALTSRTGDPHRKKILTLARQLNTAITRHDQPTRRDDKIVADTSDLVRIAFAEARSNTPLDNDKQILAFALKLIQSTENYDRGGGNAEVCHILDTRVEDPRCRKIFSLISEIPGARGDKELMVMGISKALQALAGSAVDFIELGRTMADSFSSVYSQNDAYQALFRLALNDPAYSDVRQMLTMGQSAIRGYCNTEDRVLIARSILDRIQKGEKDTDTTPVTFTREITHIPPSVWSRFNVMEEMSKELLNQIQDPNVTDFLKLAQSFVKDCADFSYSCQAFDKVLDKTEELQRGKQFHLIQDPLEVINTVPDKLVQANMLRQLVLRYAGEQIKQKTIGPAVEGPLEDISVIGENSSERLKMALDLLNILSFYSRNPGGAYAVLGEIYDRFPEKERDLAAYSFFSFLRTDPGSKNMDRIRSSYMKPEQWKALGDTVTQAGTEKSIFTLLVDGLKRIDSLTEDVPRGALSFVLLRETEKRGLHTGEIDTIMGEYKDTCNHERSRLSSKATQDTLCRVLRAMLEEMGRQDRDLQLVVGCMTGRWKDGDPETNRKLILKTLEDIDNLQKGRLSDIDRWITGKVLGEEGQPQAKQQILCEDDYVIVGGVILPKRSAPQGS